tara:strand:+ start:2342 stop:2743 length:402 start_codon:yes stop_codon:yes gene_type:complete
MESFLIELKDRLVLARKEFGKSQKDLAKRLDISVATLNRYEKGIRIPDSNFLKKFSQETKCNIEWLLMGKDSRIKSNQPKAQESDEEEMYRAKFEEAQEKIIGLLEENNELRKQIADLEPEKKSRVKRKTNGN